MSTEPNDLQARALNIIANGGVRQIATVADPVRIASPNGIIWYATIAELAREGWVRIDSRRSLHDGQDIEITQSGLSLLPGNRVPDTEAAGEGRTGDQVLAAALRAAIRYGDADVTLYDDGEVQIGGSDDTVLLSLKGRRFTPTELARFLGIDPGLVIDAR
ncbi:hypothetical protein [Streptomyces sp. NPDC006334]|uniref:hypothetical protein n=1 Tax=Streptomyces sp. NPDC006334 TaxID=3156754 RepID=UPI0033A10572